MKLQETVSGQPKDIDLGYPATASPYFNGNSDQIDIPYSEDLNPTSFTVEMWVQFQGGGGYRAILTSVSGSRSVGRRGYVFCVNAAQQWQFWIGSGHKGIPWIIITGSKAQQGVWTHIAGTYNAQSQTMILYVNGQPVGKYEEIPFQPNDRHPIHVGAGATEQAGASSCFFHGSITKVRIWERALTSVEIQNIAAQGQSDRLPQETVTPPTTTSPPTKQTEGTQTSTTTTLEELGLLVDYWALNEESGNTAYDKAKNTNHGTIHGATWLQTEVPILDSLSEAEKSGSHKSVAEQTESEKLGKSSPRSRKKSRKTQKNQS